MSARNDFVRVFHPTADEEYANRSVQPVRRHSDLPAADSGSVLTFVAGAMLGAIVVLAYMGGLA